MAGETLVNLVVATDWYKTWEGWLAAIVAGLGGGGAVAIAVTGFTSKFFADRAIENRKSELAQETERLKSSLNDELERLKGDIARETETHKTKLKWIEFVQGKQVEAILSFAQLNKSIQPKQMEDGESWDEACARIVMQFSDLENKFDNYKAEHAVFISEDNEKILQECIHLAAKHKFDVSNPYDDASSAGLEAADSILTKLNEIEGGMKREIRGFSRH